MEIKYSKFNKVYKFSIISKFKVYYKFSIISLRGM